MGKQSANKSRHQGQTPGRMPAYFPASGSPAGPTPPDQPAPNMAPRNAREEESPAAGRRDAMAHGADQEESEDSQITRRDLVAVSTELKHHISSLVEGSLQTINAQLKALNDSLKAVADTADKAFDMAAAQEKAVKDLTSADKAIKDRLTILELKSRALNIKFRGLPESQEINNNLPDFMTSWLALLSNEGESRQMALTAAFRLGAASLAKPNYPRDILVIFQSAKDKEAVMTMARHQRALKYKNHNIIALLDLPPDILAKRKVLKPITDQLKSKNVRFRWSATSDIIVMKDGAQYRAEDLPSGRTLLEALEISLPPTPAPP